MKYTLNYTVARVDSDTDEVAEEASLDFSEAKAECGIDETTYYVSHEINADTDEIAIKYAKEIINISALDIDIFSLERDGETIFSEEDEEA